MQAAGYISNGVRDVEALVTQHAPLVKRIAYHMSGRLPSSVQIDDLIQAGMVGLLEAARNYDASQGASFETYAGIRIRGGMLDEVRRNDWAPRSVHRKGREVSAAMRKIENATGRDAQPEEVAKEMGLSIDEYHKMLDSINGHRVFGFEDIGIDENHIAESVIGRSGDPEANLAHGDLKAILAEAIAHLPERERLVLSLYYDEELNLREIGEVLSVSESRVCQIRTQALSRLQSRLARLGDAHAVV